MVQRLLEWTLTMFVAPETSVAAFLAILSVGAGAAPDEAEAYGSAFQLYQLGELSQAANAFQRIEATSVPLRSMARFALGNIRVRQALQPGLPVSQANALLLEAIGYYRATLAAPARLPIRLEDVRHNLELAKRLLCWPSQQPAMTNASSPSLQKPTRPEDKTSAQRTAVTSEQDVANSAEPVSNSTTTSEDRGEVRQPLPGLPFTDPGSLSATAARERLSSAVQRVARERGARLQSRPSRQNGLVGDY